MKRLLLFIFVAASAFAQVPASYFGMAISQNPAVVWPNANGQPLKPTCARAWDSGTDWASIEQTQGVYTWAPLDTFVTQAVANGQCVLWTLGKVPPFYSPVATDSTCAELTGSCDGVNDVNADGTGTDAHFSAFIRAAQLHYGTSIGYVEMWNEANNINFCTSSYTGGTAGATCTAQALLRMMYDARNIWPSVTFTAPSMCICTNTVFTQGGSSAQNVQAGLAYFLAASIMGGSVTGANQSQIIASHNYVGNNPAANIVSSITGTRTAMTTAGVGALPLWVTEDGWGANTVHTAWGCTSTYTPTPFTQTCLDNQAAYLAQLIALAASNNTQAFFWYAWGNNSQGTLYNTSNGALFPDAVAWQSIQKWLTGATFTAACSNSSTVWTCKITRPGGYQAELVWDTSQSCTPCTTSTYSVPVAYQGGTQYDLAGDAPTSIGTTTQIGIKPILLSNTSCAITAPSSGQMVTAIGALQLTATISNAATNVPAPYDLDWLIDYQYWASGLARRDPGKPDDYRDQWQGPWTVNWWPGQNGDGAHYASGYVYDIFGNLITTCPAVGFMVNLEGMSNSSINVMPNVSGGGGGPISVVNTVAGQDASGMAGTSIATSGTWNSTSGNLELCETTLNFGPVNGVKNAAGQIFNQISNASESGDNTTSWWYRNNIVGTTGEVVTASTTNTGYRAILCFEIHGLYSGITRDTGPELANTFTATTLTTPTFSSNNPVEILFLGAELNSFAATPTTGTIGGASATVVCSGASLSCASGAMPLLVAEYVVTSTLQSSATFVLGFSGSLSGTYATAGLH